MEKVKMMKCCKRRKLDKIRPCTTSSSMDDDGPLALMNEDSLRELLSWLPTMDLYRAKCVCRRWHSIIASPDFVEMHSRRKKEACLGLVIATADDKAQELVFHYSPLHKQQNKQQRYLLRHKPRDRLAAGIRGFVPRLRFSYSEYRWMTQVVNGLVCLYSTNRLCLVNICTREIVDLPPAPSPRLDYHTAASVECRIDLTFGSGTETIPLHRPRPPRYVNATKCTTTYYHLGFDPVRKVYKVVCLSYMCTKDCSGPADVCQCPTVVIPQILTLSGSDVSSYRWRELPCPTPTYKARTQAFYVNGILWWMRKIIDATRSDGRVPAFFHVVNEFFSFTLEGRALPDDHEFLPLKLSQFRGRLALVDCSSSSRGTLHFYSYTEKDHKWEKDTIDLPPQVSTQCGNGVIPVGSLPNGDVVLANVRAAPQGESAPVCSYNCETKRFKLFQVGKFPPPVAAMSAMEVAAGITCLEESLTPLSHLLWTTSTCVASV